MPNHIDTIQLTPEQLERGAREEGYRNRWREYLDEKISNAEWDRMVAEDDDFRRWLWRQGA